MPKIKEQHRSVAQPSQQTTKEELKDMAAELGRAINECADVSLRLFGPTGHPDLAGPFSRIQAVHQKLHAEILEREGA
jgi:hypothetical protein